MSKSLATHQLTPTKTLVNTINAVSTRQERQRGLQLQGNDALSLAVVDGYFAINLPTDIEPSVATVDVAAPDGDTVMFASLMFSVFYPVDVGGASPTGFVFDNMDVGNFYPDNLTWDCFLAYDSRNKGAGSLANEAAVLATAVPSNVARITATIRANDTWSIPGGAETTAYLFYQIRATLM